MRTLNIIMNKRSVKIEILSFVMALIIVWRHAALPTAVDQPWWYFYGYIGSQTVYSALSMFMFTAGFLLFRSYRLDCYVEKLRSRFRSLLVPYLIWNVASTLIVFSLVRFVGPQSLPDHYSFDSVGQVIGDMLMARYSILWFLADLFIYVLVSPLLYYLLKDRRRGVLAFIIFTAITAFLHHPHFSPLNWLPYYFMGGWIGHHNRDFLFRQQHPLLSLVTVILWGICFTVTFFYGNEALDVPTRMLAPFCFCGIYDGLNRLLHFRSHRIYSYSFFIYALHYIPLGFGKCAILQYLPAPLSYYIAYLCLPITVVLFSIFTAWLIQSLSPLAYSKLSGGR